MSTSEEVKSNEGKMKLLEANLKTYQLWLQHRINICVQNPDGNMSPIDCYEDAMGVFKITFMQKGK